MSNFVLKLSNDTALITLGGRLFQSLITPMLKKCLRTLFLTNDLFILNLYLLVMEVLLISNSTFSDSSSPLENFVNLNHVTFDPMIFHAWYIDSTKTINIQKIRYSGY